MPALFSEGFLLLLFVSLHSFPPPPKQCKENIDKRLVFDLNQEQWCSISICALICAKMMLTVSNGFAWDCLGITEHP